MTATLRRVHRLTSSQRWWVLGTALAATVTLASGVGLVALAAYVISRAAEVDATADLALAITGVRFFAVMRAAMRYVERYLGHLATFRTLTVLRVWFYRSVEPLAPARLLQRRRGDLLAGILGDIDTVGDYPLRVVVPVLAASAVTVITGVALGSIAPLLGVVVVAYLVFVGVCIPSAARRLGSASAAAASQVDADLESEAVESVGAMAELVAFDRTDKLAAAMAELTDARCRIDRRLALVRGGATGLVTVLVGASAMTLFALTVPMLNGPDPVDGTLLAVAALVSIAAFEAVAPLAAAMESAGRARAAARRLDELLDSAPEVTCPDHPKPGPDRTQPVDLDITDLSFSYTDEEAGNPQPLVLDELSARIPAGSRVAIVGPSGAGKSTLVSLLLRFHDYDRGHIGVRNSGTRDSTDLGELDPDGARALFAAVEQHDHLFDTTVRDNLLLADADASDERIRSALDAADAAGFVDSTPEGLGFRVGEDGNRLSGGERQRLMIARALLAEAPVLVLDEATAHLDAETADRVLEGVDRWQGDRTVVLISHPDSLGDWADVVIQMPPAKYAAPG